MPTDEELEHLKKQTSNPGACMKCQEEVERLRYREKNHLSTIEHQAFLINRDIGLSAENERLQYEVAYAPDQVWSQIQESGIEFYELGPHDDPPGDAIGSAFHTHAAASKRCLILA